MGAQLVGAPPVRGQVQQREEGQEFFGFPLGILMLNSSDGILLCKHIWNWSGHLPDSGMGQCRQG